MVRIKKYAGRLVILMKQRKISKIMNISEIMKISETTKNQRNHEYTLMLINAVRKGEIIYIR